MKNKALLCGVFLVSTLFLITVTPILGLPDSPSISSHGTISYTVSWLHTSGIFIYNDAGRRINLYSLAFHYGGWEGIYLGDVQNAKAWGFNTFRLHLYWGLLQPYNETLNGIDVSYFTTAKPPLQNGIDDVVNWAVQQNLYVEINLVWTESYPPPSWAFPGVTDDGQKCASLINGTASKERTGFNNLWKFIANRYKNIPNIIFEILNEPWVNDQSLAGTNYKAFNEEVISAIESVETNSHLKMVEFLASPPGYEEILDTALDINKQNMLWATHFYTPMNDWDPNGSYYHGAFTWYGQYFPEGWGNATTYVAWRIIRCADKIHSWNKPWINTEFGKVVTQTGWDIWFNAVLKTHADYDATGWALWCYVHNPSTATGWNINDPTTRQLIMSVVTPYMVQP